MRRLWSEAYAGVRRGPNKYARAIRGILTCTGAISFLFVLILVVLGFIYGFDRVAAALGTTEFVYGVVMRGTLLLLAVLFVSFLLAGWVEN